MKLLDRIGILLVVLTGYALRVFRLDAQELRGDEAFGYFFLLKPYRQIISATLSLQEPHPVFSYLLQKSWLSVAGQSEFALRYAGALFSVAAVALLFRLVLETRLPTRIALLSALLLAASPYAVWHSQDARMYSMSMAMTLGSTLLVVVWLRRPNLPSAALYVAVSLLALHTHYFAAFIILAQNLFVVSQLVAKRNSLGTAWRWALIQIALWVLYAPWLVYARDILTGYQGNGDSPTAAVALLRSLSVFAAGETIPISERSLWATVGLLLIGLGLFSLASSPRYRPAAWLFGLYLAIPVFAAWYGAQARPIFDERYLAAAAPPFFALAASAMLPLSVKVDSAYATRWRWLQGAVASLLIIGLLTGAGLSLARYYTDPAYSKTRGWRELAQTLERLSACYAPEQVRLVQNYPDPTLWYYFDGAPRHLVLPPLANDATLAKAEVDNMIQDGVQMALFIAQPAQSWDAAGIGASALNEAFVATTTDRSSNWPIVIYARTGENISRKPTEFENGAMLVAHRLMSETAFAGGSVVAMLEWDVSGMDENELVKVFVQLIDEGGRLVAQQDRLMQQSITGASDDLWSDGYGILLPDELPVGNYRVIAGLYRPESGAKRIVTTGGEDYVDLGQIGVVAGHPSECGPQQSESGQP